jgi:uncharacterized protein (TIGR02001 family)
MKKSILLSVFLSLVVGIAHAQTAAPAEAASAAAPEASPFTANVSLTTNYKYRGQDQGSFPTKAVRPAIQGGFDWTMNGFYVGNWNSSIGWLGSAASMEMDLYGGYRGEITKDVTYDVGILRYQYVGAAVANTTEIYGSIAYGPASLKYSHTVSSDYFGFGSFGVNGPVKGRNTGYLDLSGNFPVMDVLTINAHIGYTRFASELRDNVLGSDGNSLPNYYDYKIGATYDLSKFAGSGVSIAGAIVGASKKDSFQDGSGTSINKARLIVTLTKTL